MRNLGNRLTLHSPSRGFSMELGAAITIILATRLSQSFPHFSLYCPTATNTSFRTPRLYYSVHYWCHRRCWSLLWYLALYQLAHGCLDLHGLDHHSPCRWCHLRRHLWYHHQRSSLGLLWLESHSLCLLNIYIHSLKAPFGVCYNTRMATEHGPGYLYCVARAAGFIGSMLHIS
jgi:hypothetical protein